MEVVHGDRLAANQPQPPPEPTAHGRRPCLPRGLSAEVATATAAFHRERITCPTASLVLLPGLQRHRLPPTSSRSRNVSRGVFYEYFLADKADAVSDAQIRPGRHRPVGAAFAARAPWPTRIRRGVEHPLHLRRAQPDFAVLQFLETYAIGDPALRRVFESRDAYQLFLEEGYRLRPQAAALPRASVRR